MHDSEQLFFIQRPSLQTSHLSFSFLFFSLFLSLFLLAQATKKISQPRRPTLVHVRQVLNVGRLLDYPVDLLRHLALLDRLKVTPL